MFVAEPVTNEPQDIQLAVRKILFSHVLCEARSYRMRHMPPASMNGANHVQHLRFRHALQDVRRRAGTQCTLYTLEMHIHYLHEVKESDALEVHTSILDADRKRFHAGCRFTCPRLNEPVATSDVMLLHVHQGDKPASAAFPPEVEEKLQVLKLTADLAAAWGPRSRKIEILRRPAK